MRCSFQNRPSGLAKGTDVKGKTIVATGATSGIGACAVEALAKQGARIVFVARDAERAEATRSRLETLAPGLGHRAHLGDLSLIAHTKRIGAEIAASEPRIDVLIAEETRHDRVVVQQISL